MNEQVYLHVHAGVNGEMHLGAKCSNLNCYLQRIFFSFIDSVQKLGLGVIHRSNAVKGVKTRVQWNEKSRGEAAGFKLELLLITYS